MVLAEIGHVHRADAVLLHAHAEIVEPAQHRARRAGREPGGGGARHGEEQVAEALRLGSPGSGWPVMVLSEGAGWNGEAPPAARRWSWSAPSAGPSPGPAQAPGAAVSPVGLAPASPCARAAAAAAPPSRWEEGCPAPPAVPRGSSAALRAESAPAERPATAARPEPRKPAACLRRSGGGAGVCDDAAPAKQSAISAELLRRSKRLLRIDMTTPTPPGRERAIGPDDQRIAAKRRRMGYRRGPR